MTTETARKTIPCAPSLTPNDPDAAAHNDDTRALAPCHARDQELHVDDHPGWFWRTPAGKAEITARSAHGIYGKRPTSRGGGSVPAFNPYEDDWGNQLEED
jgi:hypothetical protein